MIDLSDWQTDCEMVARGQTLRFNHIDCPAGADSRRRMYLTRPASSPDVVLAFCHNCQEHGVHRDGSDQFKDFDTGNVPADEVVDFDVPTGMQSCDGEWPFAATRWRIEKGLTTTDCLRSGIHYDPSTHRVYLPMYDKLIINRCVEQGADLLGYQLRHIEGKGPKYLTAIKDKDTKPFTVIGMGSVLCTYLVEDLASGLVMARALDNSDDATTAIIVNYGVKCTPEVLDGAPNSDYNIVWLDNDGDHIADQAHTIARTWHILTGKECYVEDQYNDPKTLDDDAIIAVHEWWKDKHYDR